MGKRIHKFGKIFQSRFKAGHCADIAQWPIVFSYDNRGYFYLFIILDQFGNSI